MKIVLKLLFLISGLLFAKSWEIEPNNKVVYSTNSGVKLKAIAGINYNKKKLCFVVKKADGSNFIYGGKLYIKFANGYEKVGYFSRNASYAYACISFDIEKMAGSPVPYNYFSQGNVKLWVKSDNGDIFNFPDFRLKVVDPIKIKDAKIESTGKYYTTKYISSEPDIYWQKYSMSFKLTKQPIVVGIKSLDTGDIYYLMKDGALVYTPPFITKKTYNSDKTEWKIEFRIKQAKKPQNKTFRLFVQDYRAKNATELIDKKDLSFFVDSIPVIKITNFKGETYIPYRADKDKIYIKLTFDTYKKPKNIWLISQNKYKLVSNGGVNYFTIKEPIIDFKYYSNSSSHSYNGRSGEIYLSIYKAFGVNSKSFTLKVEDFDGYIDTKTITISIEPKEEIKSVAIDKEKAKIPATFTFIIETSGSEKYLKVESSDGEIKLSSSKNLDNIQIAKIDDTHWKVVYTISNIDKAKESKYLIFTLLDSNFREVTFPYKKSFIVYKDTSKEDFANILEYLNRSPIIKSFELDKSEHQYHLATRADATLILYEFLKLKNNNFKLPYNIDLYENPFADVDENSAYYEALMTLANYKGNDEITVITKEFGAFNPLENVTRFQFVKMVTESLNLPKINDYSILENFVDYNTLKANDAKMYFATAVKYGIIKGSEYNELLPYDKLTVFQMLTILSRIKDFDVKIIDKEFLEPNTSNNENIGKTIGIMSGIQEYDPTINPIKINSILKEPIIEKDNKCYKLIVKATVDPKAEESYEWSANFGYFKSLDSSNYKKVIFCPATKMPPVDYVITVKGSDGYINFDEKTIKISKHNFTYKENISNEPYVNNTISLSLISKIMKENSLFTLNKKGSLYKDNIDIGIEKIVATLKYNDKKYLIDNVKWDKNKIYFTVPSIEEFFGKDINLIIDIGTNKNYKTFTYSVKYIPQYLIQGKVERDENGVLPKYVIINGKEVSLSNNGTFSYLSETSGTYKVEINKNYPVQIINLTNKIPTKYIYFHYIDKDYDNDGIENDKDAFPYDPAISKDEDKDGFPDSYNPGYTTASLPLDKYPNDPNKWTDEGDDSGSENNQIAHNDDNNNMTKTEDKGNIINNNNNEVSSTEKIMINLKIGWNLISIPVDKEIDVYDYFFNSAKIVWKWDSNNQKWLGWSPYPKMMNILEKYKEKEILDTFNKIKPGEGFWIYSEVENVLNFEGNNFNALGQINNLKAGWNLIGVGSLSIEELESFEKIKFIWKYSNGKWKLRGKNLDENIYKKYEKIEKLKPTDGVWVYIKD